MKPLHTEAELNHKTQLAEPPYHLEIQVRAYELYEQRGKEHSVTKCCHTSAGCKSFTTCKFCVV